MRLSRLFDLFSIPLFVLVMGSACGDSTLDAAVASGDAGVASPGGRDSAVDATDADAGPVDSAVGQEGTRDAGHRDASGSGPKCPPIEPFGFQVGERAPPLTLQDCDGNPVFLHDWCGASGAYLFTFAEWCSICRGYAAIADQLLGDLVGEDNFPGALVIVQNTLGDAPDLTSCRNVEAAFDLPFPVWIDPNGTLATTDLWRWDTHVILDSSLEVVFRQVGSRTNVRETIEAMQAE